MNELSKSLVPSKNILKFLWTIAQGPALALLGLAACARPSPPVTGPLLGGDCSCTADSRSTQEPPGAVPPPADAPAPVQAADSARPAPLAAAAFPASPEGLWEGVIFIQRGWLEVELLVELIPGGGGGWAGNADLPTQSLQFVPLTQVAVDGRKVSFEIHHPAEGTRDAIDARFEGALSEDGRTLSGKFVERKTFDFALHRIGEAGMERPVPAHPDLHLLADRGDELKEMFNREQDKLRLVMLLSPT